MGYVHADITLKNPRLPELRPLVTKAMVDTGSLMLCIPEHICLQLKLEENSKREVKVKRVPNLSPHIIGRVA